MCLFTPLKLKSSNQFGEWISSDKNLIRMENDTRIGRVLGSKESHVTLTHSLHPAAPLQIKVVPIDRINMLPYNRPLTNAHGVISELPLVLEGEEMQRKSNLVNSVINVFCLKYIWYFLVCRMELSSCFIENHYKLSLHL